MSIEHRCLNLLRALSHHKHDKESMFFDCVNKRLNNSFTSYEKDISSGVGYLERRNDKRVLKKINKL